MASEAKSNAAARLLLITAMSLWVGCEATAVTLFNTTSSNVCPSAVSNYNSTLYSSFDSAQTPVQAKSIFLNSNRYTFSSKALPLSTPDNTGLGSITYTAASSNITSISNLNSNTITHNFLTPQIEVTSYDSSSLEVLLWSAESNNIILAEYSLQQNLTDLSSPQTTEINSTLPVLNVAGNRANLAWIKSAANTSFVDIYSRSQRALISTINIPQHNTDTAFKLYAGEDKFWLIAQQANSASVYTLQNNTVDLIQTLSLSLGTPWSDLAVDENYIYVAYLDTQSSLQIEKRDITNPQDIISTQTITNIQSSHFDLSLNNNWLGLVHVSASSSPEVITMSSEDLSIQKNITIPTATSEHQLRHVQLIGHTSSEQQTGWVSSLTMEASSGGYLYIVSGTCL